MSIVIEDSKFGSIDDATKLTTGIAQTVTRLTLASVYVKQPDKKIETPSNNPENFTYARYCKFILNFENHRSNYDIMIVSLLKIFKIKQMIIFIIKILEINFKLRPSSQTQAKSRNNGREARRGFDKSTQSRIGERYNHDARQR